MTRALQLAAILTSLSRFSCGGQKFLGTCGDDACTGWVPPASARLPWPSRMPDRVEPRRLWISTPAVECRLIARSPARRAGFRTFQLCVGVACVAAVTGCASIRRANQISDAAETSVSEPVEGPEADSSLAHVPEEALPESVAVAPPVADSGLTTVSVDSLRPEPGASGTIPPVPPVAVSGRDSAGGAVPDSAAIAQGSATDSLTSGVRDSSAVTPPAERLVYGPPVPAGFKRGAGGVVPSFGLGSVLRRTPKLKIADLKGGVFLGVAAPLYDHQPGRFEPPIPDSTTSPRVLEMHDNPNYTPTITFDPDRGTVSQSESFAGVPITYPFVRENHEYGAEQFRYALRNRWRTYAQQYIQGTDFWNDPFNSRARKLRIEAELPSALTNIFGSGAHFDISGSERIAIGGTSDFTKFNAGSVYARRSIFPSLNMRQDLQVQLGGSIGDKIKVDVDQRSNVSSDLENHIGINYTGYRDEIIQELNLGNTSLSLQGSRYVSYGGQHQGLFGIRSELALGGVEITSIASKEQAKGGVIEKVPERDKADPITVDQYIHGRVFFLTSPKYGAPPGDYAVDEATLRVYIGDPRSSYQSRPGRAWLFPDDVTPSDSVSIAAYFTEKTVNIDYRIDPFYSGLPVIVLNEPIQDNQTLAVSYRLKDTARTPIGLSAAETPAGDTLRLKALRVANGDARNPKDLNHGPWAPLRIYENRCWYDLGTTGFKPEAAGFRLNIFRVNGAGQDADNLNGQRYIQLLGLDREDGTFDSAGNPTQRADGRVDTRYFDVAHGYLRFPYNQWEPFWGSDPDLQVGPKAESPLGTDVEDRIYVEDWSSVPRPQDYVPKYYIQAEGIGVVTRLELGKTDIREGSEQVEVDGLQLVRDTDYSIDYTTGVLELKSQRARKADGHYRIAYSYNPLFGLAQNSIMGTSAKFGLGKVGSNGQKPHQISATWLYEGRGGVSKLEHPKLQDAPSKTLVGDVSGAFQFKPEFLNRLVDALPLVRSGATPSQFALEGEVGVSAPNPNTRNLAFLDDMQSTRRVNSVLPDFQRWFWSGVPEGIEATAFSRQEAAERQAAFRWYNLPSDKEVALTQADVYPDSILSQSEKTSPVTVLNWRIDPSGGTQGVSTDPSKAWAGLTQLISTTGEDFSQWQYLDVYLRVADSLDIPKTKLDQAALDRMQNLKLHIDFGIVSEDAEWKHGVPPDGLLSTEDRDHNNDFANSIEDTGLDTLWSNPEALARPGSGSPEPGISAENPDPSRDDYAFDVSKRPKYDFSKINGTELNHHLDTEDLNGNNTLDTRARYFEFTLNLGGQAARDEAAKYPELQNGFRLFQIPLGEGLPISSDGINRPTWQQIQHCRIWVEGAEEPVTIQLVRLDVVGNTWLERPSLDPLTAVTVRVASTKGAGSTSYTPPPGSVQRDPSSIDRGVLPENSLILDFANLRPQRAASAFRNLSIEESYVQYDSLEMWVRRPDLDARNDSSTFFFRFGADSVNYYEYRTQLGSGLVKPGDWRAVFVPLEAATRTKLEPDGRLRLERDFARADSFASYRLIPRGGNAPPDTVLAVGAPSLTKIKRIELGVINRLEDDWTSGQLFVDEVRIGAVRKERGLARRASASGNLSDLGSMAFSYEEVDANFLRIGAAEGSGKTTRQMNASGTLAADHFLPSGWGMNIPLKYDWSQNRDTPKFQPASDTRYSSDLQQRYRGTTGSTGISTGFNKRATHNAFMRYTLDAFSTNASYIKQYSITTTSIDSQTTTQGGLSYKLQAGIPRAGGTGQLLLPVLPWGKVIGLAFPRLRTATLRYMPTAFGVDVTANSQHQVHYVRSLSTASRDSDAVGEGQRSALKGATISGRMSFQPFDDLRNVQFSASSRRDLAQTTGRSLPILGNSGREVASSKALSFDYQPGFLRVVGGSIGFDGNSSINADAALRQPGDSGDVFAVENSRRLDFSGRVPVQWIFGRPRNAPKTLRQAAAEDTTRKAPKGPGFNPVLSFRRALTRILSVNEAITVTHQLQRGSRYDRVGSLPSLSYQLGLTSQSNDLTQLDQYRFGSSRHVVDQANVRGTVLGLMTISARYNVSEDANVANGAGSPSRSTVWPDLSGNIPALEQKVPVLKKVFSTLSFDTSYRKQSRRDFADASKTTVQQLQEQTAWQPFIALQGSFRSGVTTSFRSEHNKSVTSNGPSGGFNNSETWDYSLDVRKQFDTQHGFPLPWGGKIKLHSPLNTSFGFTYNTSRSGNSLSARLTEDTRKWNLVSTADYNVGQDVRTSFNLQVGRTTPRLDGNWRQTVKLETALEYFFQ